MYNADLKNKGKVEVFKEGYITLIISLFILPIPLAIATFIFGIVSVVKGKSFHGIILIILSSLVAYIAYYYMQQYNSSMYETTIFYYFKNLR